MSDTDTLETWIIVLCVLLSVMTIVVILCAIRGIVYNDDVSSLTKQVEEAEIHNKQLYESVERLSEINADLEKQNSVMQSKLDTIEKLRETAKTAYKMQIKLDKSVETEEVKISGDFMPLPAGMTNTYRCEDFRKFTDTKSDHYQLQLECATDMETGIRFYRKDGVVYLCAALGGAYCSSIGEAYKITLKCGYVFNVVSADFKHANQITDPDPTDYGDADTNYDKQPATNVIEFVYDKKIAPQKVIMAGTMSALDKFGGLYGDGGNIVSMERLGKVWIQNGF